jgi:hypothetical protein
MFEKEQTNIPNALFEFFFFCTHLRRTPSYRYHSSWNQNLSYTQSRKKQSTLRVLQIKHLDINAISILGYMGPHNL